MSRKSSANICSNESANRAWYHVDLQIGEFAVIHELLHALGLGENPLTCRQLASGSRPPSIN